MVQALLTQGRAEEAKARARWAWVNLSFDAGQEAALLTLVPQDAAAHQARLDRLLWENKVSESKRMLPRVSAGWGALAQARLALKARAEGLIRISSMTLPHGMVRVMLAEQLYRAWTITQNHPYHRV